MTHFKTKKANLLFLVLPKDAMSVCIDDNDVCFIQKCITKYIGINKGYTLIGKLSTITEEVAKGLVGGKSAFRCYHLPKAKLLYRTAIESLTSIATHLGMELTDNIYLLKKI